MIVLDIKITEKNTFKELGPFNDGSLQGFSFCPPKTFKPNKQTTQVIYMELRGVVKTWIMISSLLSFTAKKLMNAEVFAKGIGKCRLLTGLLGQNVEKVDDYGCPKIQDLVGEGKADSSWICSS